MHLIERWSVILLLNFSKSFVKNLYEKFNSKNENHQITCSRWPTIWTEHSIGNWPCDWFFCFSTFWEFTFFTRFTTVFVKIIIFICFFANLLPIGHPRPTWIGPHIDKKIKKNKWPKKFDRSFCFCYLCLFVCVSVCVSVSALQVTVFVVGRWFLAWGILKWNPKNGIICFWKFWDLT